MFPLGPNLASNSENRLINRLKTRLRSNHMVSTLRLKKSKKTLILLLSKQKLDFLWFMALHKKRLDKVKVKIF